jgi:hypothetical protein
MGYLSNILFLIIFSFGIFYFAQNVKKIIRRIKLGREVNRTDQPNKRWQNMLRVAFGQSKMVARPIPAILHGIVYVGFVMINLELLEIIIDGIFGTHRILSFMGVFYDVLIASFEILAFLVIVAVVICNQLIGPPLLRLVLRHVGDYRE